MKAKYKKLIILASSALSLLTAAAIVLPSTSNLLDLMRAADTSVTDGTITFSGSNTSVSYGTRTTAGTTVRGATVFCKSFNNAANAGNNYVAAFNGNTSYISFYDSTANDANEFEFQKVKGISITKDSSYDLLTYRFVYTLSSGTSGTTDTQATHYSGTKTYNLATLCGGNVTKLTIECVSKSGDAYLSQIVLTYDCTPVVIPDLDSIEITTAPTKTTYYDNESFDPTGMVVTATYSDGSEAAVTGYTYPTSTLSTSDTSVTISYTERGITRTTTQLITVTEAPTLTGIEITTAPTKTEYIEGECFDPTGMVVTATYSDESTRDVTASCTFSPDEETELTTSDTEITISFGGQTATQNIIVAEVPSADINGFYSSPDQGSNATMAYRYLYITLDHGVGTYVYHYEYKSNQKQQKYSLSFTYSVNLDTGVISFTYTGMNKFMSKTVDGDWTVSNANSSVSNFSFFRLFTGSTYTPGTTTASGTISLNGGVYSITKAVYDSTDGVTANVVFTQTSI